MKYIWFIAIPLSPVTHHAKRARPSCREVFQCDIPYTIYVNELVEGHSMIKLVVYYEFSIYRMHKWLQV